MRNLRRFVAALAIAMLLANAASAAVHQWRVDEIYSNASGSVQFIEMTTAAPSEDLFLSTHASFNAKNPAGVTQGSFAFPNDVAGSTSNKTVLIGTSNLGSLAGVTPDYVIPANFLLRTGGKLEFTSTTFGSIDTSTFPLLVGGITSYNPATALTASNTPKNFAGVQGFVVPEPSTLMIAVGGLLTLAAFGRRQRLARRNQVA